MRANFIRVLLCVHTVAATLATVNADPQFGGATAGTFTVNSFDSFEITATGEPTPYISCDDSLPGSLNFSPGTGSATLSGNPFSGSGGFYPITIHASDESGGDVSEEFDITINELPLFTSAASITFTVGASGQFTVTASGYPLPSISACCGLPAGLTFTDGGGNGSASLAGTPGPGTGGTYDLSLTADNGIGTDQQDFTLTVNEPPAITSVNHVTFHEDVGASFVVTSTGYPPPNLSKSGTLPNGITFDPATGTLGGAAALGSAGTYPITFTASNGVGTNATQSFTLVITPPLPCTAPPPGLVGWWPGDGNATDIQNDNNGTLHGAVAFAAGRVDQGFSFNGSTGYVSIGNPGVLKLRGTFTIDAWVKPTALPANGALMAVATKWNSSSSNSAVGDAYGLFLVNNNGTLQVDGRVNTVFGPLTVDGGSVPLNSFTHIALTYDPNANPALVLFVNGTSVGGTGNGGGSIVGSDVNVMIARENDNITPRFFAGIIDEVGIYNRVLTTDEFSAIYNAALNGKCKTSSCVAPPVNLVGWWSGDNSTVDLQAGLVGTLQNSTSFAHGKVGQAFQLVNINDGVEIPYNSYWDLGTDDFSIDLWVRFDGFNSQNVLVGHELPNNANRWLFTYNGFNLQFQIGGGTSASVPVDPPVTQRWYHVAVTRGGSTFKFYIDGAQVGGNQTSSSPVPAINGPLLIGKFNGFTSFIGRMDEIEIVHRAMSAAEIAAIYNAGSAGQCKDFKMYVSNNGNGTVVQIDPFGTVTPFASGLSNPKGIALDTAGNVYVAENGTHKIDKFDLNGNGAIFATGLTDPVGLAFDSSGNLYVANYSSSTIEKLSPVGSDLGAFATAPALSNPQTLTFDADGNLFASNFGNSTIEKFDPSAVATLYSNSPLLSGPTGLASNQNGNLFVSSSGTNAVVKMDSLGAGLNFATGLSTPFGAIFDSRGSLYVANQGNNTIRKVDPAGNATPFASAGLNSPILMALRQTSPIVPALNVGSANRPANNHFIVSGQALPNALVTIYATTNLANGFTKLGTTTADSTGAYQFDDSTAVGQTKRIYLAIYP